MGSSLGRDYIICHGWSDRLLGFKLKGRATDLLVRRVGDCQGVCWSVSRCSLLGVAASEWLWISLPSRIPLPYRPRQFWSRFGAASTGGTGLPRRCEACSRICACRPPVAGARWDLGDAHWPLTYLLEVTGCLDGETEQSRTPSHQRVVCLLKGRGALAVGFV